MLSGQGVYESMEELSSLVKEFQSANHRSTIVVPHFISSCESLDLFLSNMFMSCIVCLTPLSFTVVYL